MQTNNLPAYGENTNPLKITLLPTGWVYGGTQILFRLGYGEKQVDNREHLKAV